MRLRKRQTVSGGTNRTRAFDRTAVKLPTAGFRVVIAGIANLSRNWTDMAKYEPGDYVKVEFPDEETGIGEWMWVRVRHCDDEKQLVFGALDNEPINDYAGNVNLGSELGISYSQIREHRKASEFR